MQSTLRSANMNFMVQRKITYPLTQQLKILTQLKDNIPKAYRPSDDFKLASITIYTEKQSYEGQLTGKSLAKQLTWNPQSFNTLLQSIMGKRDKVQMKFFPLQIQPQKSLHDKKQQQKLLPGKKQQINNNNTKSVHNFQIVCQISSGINITLFSVEMCPSVVSDPFEHMMSKFSQIERTFRQRQRAYKSRQQQLRSQLNQIQAVQRQIIDSSSIEINLMKKQFIKHVNNEKAKIRKLMGSVPMVNPVNGMIENRVVVKASQQHIMMERIQQKDQQEGSKEEELRKKRAIRKVDREFYDNPQYKRMEVQQLEANSRQSSQQQSSNYLEVERENKWFSGKQDKRKGMKLKQNDGQQSSDDEIDPEGMSSNSDGLKKEKTYLEQQREKMQLVQGKDDKQWDALFN